MKKVKELQILEAIKRAEPVKKRVTFFVSVESKNALAVWCKKNNVTESAAVEAMIRSVVPNRYFEGRK